MQGYADMSDTLKKLLDGFKHPSIKTLYEEWFDLEFEMQAFLGELSENELFSEFIYKRSDGAAYTSKYADVFTQLALHDMQHRSECAVILTIFGHSPGNLDFIVYLNS